MPYVSLITLFDFQNRKASTTNGGNVNSIKRNSIFIERKAAMSKLIFQLTVKNNRRQPGHSHLQVEMQQLHFYCKQESMIKINRTQK